MLEGIRKIHLIGIAGTGMRAIANVLIQQGFIVSGSDVKETLVIKHFRDLGAKINIGHDAALVNGVDAVVVSTAIPADNPELVEAKKKGILVLHRSDIVKAVVDSTLGIAVAGAHGKTTTTSMLGQIFEEAMLDPTIIIGGEVNYLHGNGKFGKGIYSIVEADESDGSFLKLAPKYVVLTNVESDHMDHYKTLDNLITSFCQFVEKIPKEDGLAIACGDNNNIQYIKKHTDRTFLTYGCEPGNDYEAREVHYEGPYLVYDVYKDNFFEARIELQVPGIHNVLNSLATYIMARQADIDISTIQRALKQFIGAKRRFETKGLVEGVWVVDDYAHHPTEIKATLEAARDMGKYRVICIFQPHRYTRTESLLEDFATAFEAADVVIMTDIYSAGESPINGITGMSIPRRMKEKTGKEAIYIEDIDEVPSFLGDYVKPNDLVITMGAGSVTQYGAQLIAILEDRSYTHAE